jgi:hypothetical protein
VHNSSINQVELMNRRAGDMRTYAQDTALPGGKYEDGDIDAEGTAVCSSSLGYSSLMHRDGKLMKRYLTPSLYTRSR